MFLAQLEFQDSSETQYKYSRLAKYVRAATAEKMIQEFISNPAKFYLYLNKLLNSSIRSLKTERPNSMLEETKFFTSVWLKFFPNLEKW